MVFVARITLTLDNFPMLAVFSKWWQMTGPPLCARKHPHSLYWHVKLLKWLTVWLHNLLNTTLCMFLLAPCAHHCVCEKRVIADLWACINVQQCACHWHLWEKHKMPSKTHTAAWSWRFSKLISSIASAKPVKPASISDQGLYVLHFIFFFSKPFPVGRSVYFAKEHCTRNVT